MVFYDDEGTMAPEQLTESLRETLDLFDPYGAPRATPEVAEALDLGRRSTYERLERLAERGRLETKKVGASARVWWREAGTDDAMAGPLARSQFESLVDAAGEYAVVPLDADGRVDGWNAGARRLYGYEAEEIAGEHVSTCYTDEAVADGVPERNLERAAAAGEFEDAGWRVRAAGSRFWAEVALSAIVEDGELLGYAAVTRDMTERRQREQQLREEVSFTESVLENQRDLVYAFDESGMPVRWNDRVGELLGYRDEQIAEMNATEFVAPAAVDRVADGMAAVLDDGEAVTLEIPLLTADGERIPYEVTATPITGPDGDPVGFTGIGRDVTDRKEKERRLERRRDELAAELDDVFERISDGFVGLDEDLRFTYVNDRAASLLDIDAVAAIGRRVPELVPISAAFEAALEDAIATQEPIAREAYYEPLDAWIESAIYPSETGLSVYFRDVSERKERERELELYETLLEESRDVNAVIGTSGEFEYLTPSVSNVLGYEPAELVGENGFEYIHPEDRERAMAEFSRMIEQPAYEPTLEFRFERADGEWAALELHARNLLEEPGIEGLVAYTRDVTARRERERELELYETLFEESRDVNAVLDADGVFEYVTPSIANVLGHDPEAIVGENAFEFVHPDDREPTMASFSRMIEDPDHEPTVEFRFADGDGGWTVVEARARNSLDDPDIAGIVVYTRDVTERRERERSLERRVRQQQVVADLGQDALETRDLDGLMADAAALVADVLDNDYCKVLDLDADAERLRLRQGVGWQEGITGTATVSAVEDDSQAAYTLRSKEPVVVSDLDTERRFSGPDLLRDHDVKSGISTIIGPFDDPWGILGTHDTDRKEFSDHDVNFVQAVATILATAIERRVYERQQARQREQLAALNGLNEVVRDITDAVVEQSTREEIETAVCEGLAAAESFAFAWIGDVDPASQTVALRTEGGVEGYLDDITISLDPDAEYGTGPTAEAFRTGEIQTVQDSDGDRRHEPWREHVDRHAVRSSAAIPIRHDDSVYGVLNVYADRPNAFTGEEQAVIAQLGEVVGHAIAAVERKRALMSDEIVELEFQLPNAFDALGIDVAADGWFSLDEAVPTGEGTYLIYGRATCPVDDVLSALVAALPHWEGYEVIAERSGRTRFEVRLSEPPILSAVASRGGHVEEAIIDAGGDYTMRIQLPPSVEVRTITDVVEDAYPDAKLLAQRQLSNTGGSATKLEPLLHEQLTERQRTVLTAAYHAGFFEWPRDSNGETVADSLGVSSPTFHQHLRKAEGTIFDALFSAPPSDGDD